VIATDLPTGWQRVRFGDVVRKVNDRVDPETSGIERYVAGEHMDTDDLRIRHWGSVGDGYLGPAFHMRFQPGQVLYGSRRTYLRKVAAPDFEGICANTTFVLETSSDSLLPEFLPLVMTTERFHEHSVKQSKGSVNPYINFSDLAWYEFALPPAEVQQRIADLMSRFDAELAALETAREAARTLLGSIQEVCRKEGDPVPLGGLVDFISGSAFPHDAQGKEAGEYPFVKVSDFGRAADEGGLASAVNWISESERQLLSARLVPAGSSVLQKVGASLKMKRVVLAECDLCIDNNLLALIPRSPELRGQYLPHLLYAAGLERIVQEGVIPSISQRSLAALRVRLPDLSRQDRFLSQVDVFSRVIGSINEAECANRQLRHVTLNSELDGADRVH
jgi:hypothetical protein